MWLGRRHGLICEEALTETITDAEGQQEFFAEQFTVKIEATLREFHGFQLQWRKHPVLQREIKGKARVTIELRHRQRAVGLQAMVFLFIPLTQCQPADPTGDNIVGRKAKPKELVIWSPCLEVTESLVKAFGLASRSHRDDILKMLKLLRELRRDENGGDCIS